MKRMLMFLMAVSIICLNCSLAWSFNSGSTGADGAFNPTANIEVQLPESGVLNYTTVNIPSGVTVTFIKNAANTPAYILATGDVTIAGTISVNGNNAVSITSGNGGVGGFGGGYGASQFSAIGGKGFGPGGGNPGTFYYAASAGYPGGGGGYGSAGGTGGNSYCGTGGTAYGNIKIIPMIGGSGGGGGAASTNRTAGGGGGGGGAILIASSGIINITGSVTANGGTGANQGTGGTNSAGGGGGGSGGSIKLMANTITGNGAITANGGAGGSGSVAGPTGGVGRLRFEANTINRTAATSPSYSYSSPGTVFLTNTPTLTITSVAGANVPASPSGAFGTPDVILPTGTTNPVTVNIVATNIPTGTTVTVITVPEYGASASATSTGLVGTNASSTTSVSITLSTSYQSILTAQATFTIQTAMYYDDEKIEKVRVAAAMGGESEVVYITESGREIKSAEMTAKFNSL